MSPHPPNKNTKVDDSDHQKPKKRGMEEVESSKLALAKKRRKSKSSQQEEHQQVIVSQPEERPPPKDESRVEKEKMRLTDEKVNDPDHPEAHKLKRRSVDEIESSDSAPVEKRRSQEGEEEDEEVVEFTGESSQEEAEEEKTEEVVVSHPEERPPPKDESRPKKKMKSTAEEVNDSDHPKAQKLKRFVEEVESSDSASVKKRWSQEEEEEESSQEEAEEGEAEEEAAEEVEVEAAADEEPNVESSNRVLISNLPRGIKNREVRDFLQDVMEVQVSDIQFAYDDDGGFTGCACAEVGTPDDANKVLGFNGNTLYGYALRFDLGDSCALPLNHKKKASNQKSNLYETATTVRVTRFDASLETAEIEELLRHHFRRCEGLVSVSVDDGRTYADIKFTSSKGFDKAMRRAGTKLRGCVLDVDQAIPEVPTAAPSAGSGSAGGSSIAIPQAKATHIRFEDDD